MAYFAAGDGTWREENPNSHLDVSQATKKVELGWGNNCTSVANKKSLLIQLLLRIQKTTQEKKMARGLRLEHRYAEKFKGLQKAAICTGLFRCYIHKVP